jgi:hypothetical protein
MIGKCEDFLLNQADAIIHKSQAFVVRKTPWLQCTLFYTSPESDLAAARHFWNETKKDFRSVFQMAHSAFGHLRCSLKIASILAILAYLGRLHSACQHRLNKSFQAEDHSWVKADTNYIPPSRPQTSMPTSQKNENISN